MYNSLRQCIDDLDKNGHLIRIKSEVDPNLEAAEIHRRIYDAKGPAILFEKIKGSPFQAVSNIYGTIDRTNFIFRKTIPKLKKVLSLKADPTRILKSPLHYAGTPFFAVSALPIKDFWGRSSSYGETTISSLPQIKAWPDDGGAFITLPQVLSLPPKSKNIMESNIGMYRIQLSGNEYIMDQEVGLHYQLHRGIGNHHTAYNESEEDFKVSIFVGGPPSHAFSAIMPMPEGISELTFAGMLGNRRFRYFWKDGYILSSDADFVITGTIQKNQLKGEGPFGDHLGYYSLRHDFPVMKVDKVYHRKDPLWHFTVVGRPPQEDSSFGYLIHQLVEELTPQEFPGLVELNAVDAAGVHPLLLAIGKERYMPFRERVPEEILTIANRILGSGQTSLAKFLIIAANDDVAGLSTHDIPKFFNHVLERVDWKRDLHFQTKTTIDTLDYSGSGWNMGSKVVIACRGEVKRQLGDKIPTDLGFPMGYSAFRLVHPGIIGISGNKFSTYKKAKEEVAALGKDLETYDLGKFPLIVLCDDAGFLSDRFDNFLWATFTRANPALDIYGIGDFIDNKHWGCTGSLIIDARVKPHHAPELITDQSVSASVDKLFDKGGELFGLG